ncbi:MAG TPA: protein-glutamate O-methyltransferase [Spirochaetota bacterium]|nr:protein-glutamate O-methyltransferase [Spirochaetota bacterium]
MTTVDLRDRDFEKISRLVYEQCGINLHAGKKELVKARLSKRLREGSFDSFSDYFRYVTTEEGTDELISMIDSLSTNLTYFFREDKHFKKLSSIFSAIKTGAQPPSQLKIWSAGCSTGEEPYTIAMTVFDYYGRRQMPELLLLATDIDTQVLGKARVGTYPGERLAAVDENVISTYFNSDGADPCNYTVKDFVRSKIYFRRLNLLQDEYPMKKQFDIIFCRNVIIYFDRETQTRLFANFYRYLKDDGYMLIGHSENITSITDRFSLAGRTIYRKVL